MATREYHKKFEENNYDYSYQKDRGLIMRATDEIRSWFGDEQAEERRRIDYLTNEQGCREKLYEHKRYDLEKVRAHEVMTRSVIAVQPDDTVQRAAQLMTDSNCGALPVVDNSSRLIGIVTDRDLTVRSTSLGMDPLQAQVEECMTHGSIACHANDTLKDCMLHMSRHQIRRLPIINDHTQVIGILSQADLARYIGAYPVRGMRNAMADVLTAVSEPTHVPYR
jgi:signal-transduction protein with cAMP-binding, CBS, and nucleotidyltransferase domain